MPRRYPIFACDVRQLGGIVSITPYSDTVDRVPGFRIGHVSKGGDMVWTSSRIPDEDRALEAARVLAEFTGAVVRR